MNHEVIYSTSCARCFTMLYSRIINRKRYSISVNQSTKHIALFIWVFIFTGLYRLKIKLTYFFFKFKYLNGQKVDEELKKRAFVIKISELCDLFVVVVVSNRPKISISIINNAVSKHLKWLNGKQIQH